MPCACTTVRKASRALARVYDATFTAAGMNNTQFAVLRSIARHGGEPLVRVAEDLEMDRTSLYRAMAPMIRDGWLASDQGTDKRFRTARLTPKGRRALDAATKRWAKLQKEVVGRFGREAYDALFVELRRLVESAGATAR